MTRIMLYGRVLYRVSSVLYKFISLVSMRIGGSILLKYHLIGAELNLQAPPHFCHTLCPPDAIPVEVSPVRVHFCLFGLDATFTLIQVLVTVHFVQNFS